MKIKNSKGDYFVSLPNLLYSDLKEACKGKDNINFDLVAILIHLILTNKYKDKNYEGVEDWVRLSSKILRRNYDTIRYKSSEHLSFLIEHNIIEKTAHYHDPKGKDGYSRGFRINQQYFKVKGGKTLFDSAFNIVNISESSIKRKCLKRIQKRKHNADRKAKFLTNWLNSDKFTFDEASAIAFVNSKYENEVGRKNKRLFNIRNFEVSLLIYSMEGKDNRLHTCFTSLPSDLKRFVTFDGKKLKEADIKSSQPFILTIILELIIREYKSEIRRKGFITLNHFTNRITKQIIKHIEYDINKELDVYKMCYNITYILLKEPQLSDIKHIEDFIFLIRSGDIYEQVGEALFKSGTIWLEDGKYWVKLKNKDSKYQNSFDFETLRKCAKTITLNAIYCSPKTKSVRAVNEFRKLFSTVTIWIDALKKNRYNDLAILMQQIESKSVLIHCAKKISEKHPKMFLISRHDSLTTTEDKFEILYTEFKKIISNYFGIEVTLGKELW